MTAARRIPPGPLSVPVEFKAKPFEAVKPSPSPEGTVGQDIVAPIYSDMHHKTWAELYNRQEKLLDGNVCEEYLKGRTLLKYTTESVPHLADLSKKMHQYSEWDIIRVNGYVPEEIFFQLLANKTFPCTDFIRHPDELEYTPAPDMFHDLIGHLPLFTNERFASFFYLFGLAGLNAKTKDEIAWLGRIYWFTVEFGLINPTAHMGVKRDNAKTQIYGAGIVSSVGEIPYSLSEKVKKRSFDVDVVAAQEFDIHHMQTELFEISSFEELESEFKRWAVGKKLLK